MTLRFLSPAEQEYRDAFDHYESVVDGLGHQFKEELVGTLQRIQDYPDAWQPLSANTRRCRLQRFPFGVIYQKRESEIVIVAISDLSRAPKYWVERL